MSRPIPGKQYEVQKENSLSQIAELAYGDPSKWGIIFEANQRNLRSGKPDIIFPGELLIIPELTEVKDALDKLLDVDENKKGFRIEVDGRELKIQSGKIIRTMDTAADAWTAVIEWTPGADKFLDKVTAPYSFAPSKAFIDDTRLVTGPLMMSNPKLDSEGRTKDLHGFSATIAIVDSNLHPDTFEQNNISLLQRAQKLMNPYGLKVITENGVDATALFDRVSATKQEKVFDHIAKLAKQRNILVSSTPLGNLLLTRANTTSPPVDIIEESINPDTENFEAKFDGRQRFSSWRVTCKTPKKGDTKSATSIDKNVPITRHRNITVDNANKGNIQQVADWERSKRFIDALTIPFFVPSWYDSRGRLWRENTRVTIKSPTIGVAEGFTFLIRQVEYNQNEDSRTAILQLVPPQVYTGEVVQEPWKI